jgi:hypothetical protein
MVKEIARLQKDSDFRGAKSGSFRFRAARKAFAKQRDMAAIGLIQACQAGEQSRFATTGGAHNQNNFTDLNLEAHAAKGESLFVPDMKKPIQVDSFKN